MKEITAYMCADGSIHENERAAVAHDDNLLGTELDGLLRLFELDITRHQECRVLLCVMNKRGELLKSVNSIAQILNHQDGEE